MLQYDHRAGNFSPGTLPADGSKITALYARLSRDDDGEGDSGSILNQRELLLKYVLEHGMKHIYFFSDDGYSGTNFNRPDFLALKALVQQGMVENLVVKDHSRLGRDRIGVALLVQVFEDNDVHYIAINDNIDTAKGLDDMVAFRELFNEFYPRDTSKKIRAVFQSKGESGQRLCTQVPYGYTGNKYAWDIDPPAAQVVKEIFSLAVSGLGPMQIAKRLTAEGRLTPTAYKLSKGQAAGHPAPAEPTRWESSTVANILDHMEYTGCTVNFKGYKKSYKSKKRIENPPEKWKVFPDTHPAIIDQETWERVQELRKNRRRRTKAGRQGLFSGVAYCADCGARLHFATCKTFERTQDNYRCSNYKSNTGSCTAHFIREVVLQDFVLAHLRQTLAFARDHEAEFIQAVTDKTAADQKRAQAAMRKELAQAQRRMSELDTLFRRVYEDSVSGKLTEERASKLTHGYEQEQAALKERVDALTAQLDEAQDKTQGVEKFVALVRKYTEVQDLTPAIVNEFIQRIDVHAPDKSSGHRQQRVDIIYNFVGMVEPPAEAQGPTIQVNSILVA